MSKRRELDACRICERKLQEDEYEGAICEECLTEYEEWEEEFRDHEHEKQEARRMRRGDY